MSGSAVYQGYIDERSIRHISGWMRDLADASHRVAYEVMLADEAGERVLHHGRAESFSDILVRVGVGDGAYAFRHMFEAPLSPAERDRLFVRPAGSNHRLELAPALKIDPPPQPGQRSDPFQGYIDERSTRHVAGWVRNLADPSERLEVEAILPDGNGERIVWRGAANRFSAVLREVGVGDGGYAFYALLPEELSEAERDALQVRPVSAPFRLELAPALRTVFEPISHVAMDIVDNCNLRCPFCVYDYAATHRTHFMSEAVFAQALDLIPYVTDGNFWLSCLHEPTLHPGLLDFIARVPEQYRKKLFYTTNLAKRMPRSYFSALAGSGMHHLNISLESLRPEIYERMRKGARHAIFAANWDMLLAEFAAAPTAPALRYNIMAYRSNMQDIPVLAATLLAEKRAWQVEIRHTYDAPHIPPAFREAEFLTTAEWAWLAERLADLPPDRVLLLQPPGGVGHDRREAPPAAAFATAPEPAPAPVHRAVPRPLNISIGWDGAMRIYGEEPRGAGQPPMHVNYVTTNIAELHDKLGFLMAL